VAVVSMKELLEAGVHFGHRSRRWHPKMRSFIFTERNGIHIIDLQQTISRLEKAYNFVRDTVAEGGVVLFVGTKKQAQDSIQSQAERCGMPFVVNRWLGGTLTNFRTMDQRIHYMLDMSDKQRRGEFNRLTKKEALDRDRELAKLYRRFGGVQNLRRLPDAIFVADIHRETNAVKEAGTLEVPVVAMVDTNCDPDPIDYIIPSNDDAIRAIKLITTKMADAVIEGQQMRQSKLAETEGAEEVSDYATDVAAQYQAGERVSRIFEPDAEAAEAGQEFEFVESEDELESATQDEPAARKRVSYPDSTEEASEEA